MSFIENQIFDYERALYGEDGIRLDSCRFEGDADGESALKECRNVILNNCTFKLRYPIWHCNAVVMDGCDMEESCRAPMWYTEGLRVSNCRLHAPKALRECADVQILESDIISMEFGWSTHGINMQNCRASGEYFMLRASRAECRNLNFSGKYSFQYIEDAVFDCCVFDTKDAFWHAKRVTVKNSVVKGEYLGWYCEDVTFENCKIIGTQPLCYCKGLRLIGCTMEGCDLSFERSDVTAEISSPIDSVKNPLSGSISAPKIGELIRESGECKITLTGGGE